MRWPGSTAVTLVAEGGPWSEAEGEEDRVAVLPVRTVQVQVAGRGDAARVRHGALAAGA